MKKIIYNQKTLKVFINTIILGLLLNSVLLLPIFTNNVHADSIDWIKMVEVSNRNSSNGNSYDPIKEKEVSQRNNLNNANISGGGDTNCPFSPANNRTIVNFSNTSMVWGSSVTKVTRNVNLPAGQYRVSLFAYDMYDGRENANQANESYFVDFRSGANSVVKSGKTPDLQDNVKKAFFSGVVSTVNITSAVTSVIAKHSNYLNEVSGPNSVTAGCAAFDLISTPTPNNLSGSCNVNPSSINVGSTLNWSASVSGGNGNYNYSWTGTDGLSGNSSMVSKSYNSAGSKSGTVTITSGNQSIIRTCSAVVNQVINYDLSISCSPDDSNIEIDEDVTWRSNPSGGTGSYSYDWDGTDGLNGNSRNLTWSYDDEGRKTATVTVYSGGQSASASCSLRVEEEEDDDDLFVSCYASPSNPQLGVRMNWYANVYGGDGDYDYDWSGTDGLNSSSRSPSMVYTTPGSKSATVRVRDGDGNRVTRTCYANVTGVLAYSQSYQPPLASAVYLSQVPYTGVADNFKLSLFVTILGLISAWIAYIVISYKKNNA